MKKGFRFEVLKESRYSRARRGRLWTPHGVIETPAFVGVGTNGSLKGISTVETRAMGLALMFCNTYHLMLHPGPEVIEAMGGLHKFIGYPGPLITDSGGFQVFSLAYGSVHNELKSQGKREQAWVLSLNERGVRFRSYRDGRECLLTPESSVIAQQKMGADIIIPLDELPPYHRDFDDLKRSFERTHRWMRRSLAQHRSVELPQIMYGVVHGGLDPDLRKQSIQRLEQDGFEGLALGGSFGKNHDDLRSLLAMCEPHMDPALPRHLLGIADPLGMSLGIQSGCDTFDSAYPTKVARHGSLLTREGMIKIRQSQYKTDPRPIADDCVCSTCAHYTRSYLHHLLKAHEPVFMQLASVHNIQHMITLSLEYQRAIEEDRL